ncbi:hypothetical protein JCM11491_001031 [Sporobolomyces phaffii]
MPRPHHDPHSNRFLLVSVFAFAAVLLYLTTHRPEPSSTRAGPVSQAKSKLAAGSSNSAQRPLVSASGYEDVIQHRIVAIGDIHGDYPALTKILRKAALIDLKGQWIGQDAVLVQTGDIVDRGVDTIACYRFMQSLRPMAEKAGGAVVSLLGNHEIMNALGDWRYVNPTDIKTFGGERNRREAMSTGWIGQEWRANYSITARIPLSDPSPSLSPYADDDGAISFVHGGITPEYLDTLSKAESPVDAMNRIGHSLLVSLVESPNPYPVSLPRAATPEQRMFWSETGPMWNRDWATQGEGEICERVRETCKRLRVRRLVMGHTPHFEGILSRCGGRVLLIDTGISRAYGGAHSFLEITHTLSPSSRLPHVDGGSEHDESRDRAEWVEHEVVKAVYEQRESGLPGEEILARPTFHAEPTMDSTFAISVPTGKTASQKRQKSVPLHRCRFPDYTPASITCLALTPNTFDASVLGYASAAANDAEQRGLLAVGRSNGQVELMVWGGYQGWVNWRTLPSSFPAPPASASAANSRKPSPTLLSHLTWTHQTTLSPSDLAMYSDDRDEAKREVESLKRGKGVRLFGVGGIGSELVEWDWGGPGSGNAVGMIKSTLPTLPPIFALAASPSSSTLAISCEDSTIRLINILDGELELVNKIEVGGPGKVRALSLCWGPPRSVAAGPEDDDEDEETAMQLERSKSSETLPSSYSTPLESYFLAGCSNSTIRRFDAPTSASGAGPYRGTLRMTLDRLKGEHTVVWALTTLGDGTVVSGDSMGNVKFWDGEMGTQLQSFKGHKSDVLCLAVGTDGTSIYTSGIDQRTVEYRQVSVASTSRSSDPNGNANARWIQSSGRRLHSHDVRAIVVSPPYEPFAVSSGPAASPSVVPVMTSAGLDLSLILTPVASPLPSTASKRKQNTVAPNPVSNNPAITFENTVHRRAAYVPQRSNLPFSISTNPASVENGGNGRLLIARRERSVGIWRLGEPSISKKDDEGSEEVGGGGWEKAIDLDFKLQTNLISSGVSPNGKWLAVSDLYETKLFRLTTSRTGELVPRRQKSFVSTLASSISTSLGTGSSCITFSQDSTKLFLASAFGASVAVVDLGDAASIEEEFNVVAVFGEGAKVFEQRQKRKGLNGNGVGQDVEMNGGADSEDGGSDDDDDEAQTPASSRTTSSIVAVSTDQDGKWFATAHLDRSVEVYDLEHRKHLLSLPTPPSVPTALAFLPTSPSSPSALEPTLVLTFSTNILLLYGLTSRRFHPWSLPLSSSKYNTLTDIREPCLGITFEPASASAKGSMIAIVWGANWVGKIDLDELRSTNFGGATAVNGHGVGGAQKRKQYRLEADRKRAREEDDVLALPAVDSVSAAVVDIQVTRKYQPLFLFDFVQPSTGTGAAKGTAGRPELVAVERTWYDLVGQLPDAYLQSGVFGT